MRIQEQDIATEQQRIEHEWQIVQTEVRRLMELNIPHVLSNLATEIEQKGITVTSGIEIATPHPDAIGQRIGEDELLARSFVYRSDIPRVSLLLKTNPYFTLTYIHSSRGNRQEFEAYVVSALPSGTIEGSIQQRLRLVDRGREVPLYTQRGPKFKKEDYDEPSLLRQKLLDFFRT
jgi:hypothetical protein